MKVIVTPERKKIPGYLTVSSISQAANLHGNISHLIISKTPETGSDLVLAFSKIQQKVRNLTYVTSAKERVTELSLLVTGSGGLVIEDPFYLESADNLDILTSGTSLIRATQTSGGIKVLDSFLEKLKSGEVEFHPRYIDLVSQSGMELVESLERVELEKSEISKVATNLIQTTNESAEEYARQSKELQQNLSVIRQKIDERNQSSRFSSPANSSGNLLFFPVVTYTNRRNMLLVKEQGFVNYLVSFFMGFADYLSQEGRKPKLIIIVPPGSYFQERYQDFAWVTQNSQDARDMDAPIVITNYPTKKVIEGLLSDDISYDTFIILDKTNNYPQHILKRGFGGHLTAVQSEKVADQFKIPISKTITSGEKEIKGNVLHIKTIPNFPEDPFVRKATYLKEFLGEYKMLMSAQLK